THRMGRGLFGAGPGDVRGPGHQPAARQRSTGARWPRGSDRRRRRRIQRGRHSLLRGRAAHFSRGAVGGERSRRALGAVARRRGIGRPVRAHARRRAVAGHARRRAAPRDFAGLTGYFSGMKLVLFDIDGTLLWTDGAGRRAIHRALVDEAGTAGPIERYRFDGKTDPQIVRDLLSLAGPPAAAGGPAGGCGTTRGRAHPPPVRGRGRDRNRGHAGRRRVRPPDRRAQPGRRHRLLRRRGPARGRRRVRVRDARRHGRGARRHLRVSRSAPPAVDELEVKARVEDPDALRAALMRAGAILEFRGDMLDRRFDRDAAPTLAERDEVLRLRVYRQPDGATAYGVLGWKGPHSKHRRYRRRAEAEARVGDPEGVVAILERLGFAVSLRIDR